MGLKDILSGAVGALHGGSAVKAAVSVLSRFVQTPEEKQALAEIGDKAAAREHEINQAQIEVNKTEAGHRSLFVAGWRPAVGWCCVFAFGVRFVVGPVAEMFGVASPTYSAADWSDLSSVLLGMLGLGAYRTYEKVRGVSR